MSGMTPAQLGGLLLALCLISQVVCQNNTETTGGNSTMNSNSTTMTPGTYSSSGNATVSPTSAGFWLHAGTSSILIPIVVATSLLQRCC